MLAVWYSAYISFMLGTSEPAGYKSYTFQFFTSSVCKIHNTALHLRRVTVAVSAAFAGKFLSGEVPNITPPIIIFLSRFFCDFCTRVYLCNTIWGQSMFRLPPDGSVLCFQSGKAISGNLPSVITFWMALIIPVDFAIVCLQKMPSASRPLSFWKLTVAALDPAP